MSTPRSPRGISFNSFLRAFMMPGSDANPVMALPLVPGPGLLFMLLGFSVLDFPGKRAVERRLLAVGTVMRSLNGIRARFRRPPLVLDHPVEGAGDP